MPVHSYRAGEIMRLCKQLSKKIVADGPLSRTQYTNYPYISTSMSSMRRKSPCRSFSMSWLWHRLKQEGRLLLDIATGENTDGFLNFQPIMDAEKLLQGYRKLLEHLYAHKSYYQRINTFLKNYQPTVRTRVTREDVMALTRSIWQLGIKSGARFRYWKLICKTLLLKRKAVPMAVELAIFGLHFEQILRRMNINQAIHADKR